MGPAEDQIEQIEEEENLGKNGQEINKLRVISGGAGGIWLNSLTGTKTRPTSSMLKGALFSSLGDRVEGAVFVDLYAGTGQIGLEALSRGAKMVIINDRSAQAGRVIRANVAKVQAAMPEAPTPIILQQRGEEALTSLQKTLDRVDLLYFDPPWPLFEEEVQKIASVLETFRPDQLNQFLWILESPLSPEDLVALPCLKISQLSWTPLKVKAHGDKYLIFLERTKAKIQADPKAKVKAQSQAEPKRNVKPKSPAKPRAEADPDPAEAELRARAIRLHEGMLEYFGKAECTLNYETDFQLLVGGILAAQCTDERVNIITKDLFAAYPTIEAMAEADLADIERLIYSAGFYKNKAKGIQGSAKKILEDFGGKVPSARKDLLSLPGVGPKIARLLQGELFGIPAVVVDTHCKRITTLMGLHQEKEPEKIARRLEEILPEDMWISWGKLCVSLGRTLCKAGRPDCDHCMLRKDCTHGRVLTRQEK